MSSRIPGMGTGRRRRPEPLRIFGTIRGWQFVALASGVFAVLLAGWWVVTATGAVAPLFLPGPGDVLARLRDHALSGQLWDDIGASLYRIMLGFLIATVMAVPLGVLMGAYRVWEASLEPLVDFIRYMPVVAFVPLSIVWAGIGDAQKLLIIWLGTFFQQVLLTMDDVRRVPVDFVDLGRTLGLSDRKILTRIVVPSAAPDVWDTLRITLGWAWTWVVLAELVAATTGLGYRIVVAQRFFDTETIIGYILVLGALGLVTDQVMRGLGRLFFRYGKAGG